MNYDTVADMVCGYKKLTREELAEIMERYVCEGVTVASLARDYNASAQAVSYQISKHLLPYKGDNVTTITLPSKV